MRSGITVFLVFALVFCFHALAFCQENMTITTYYPSPHGVYSTLRLFPDNTIVPNSSCSREGELHYDLSEHSLYVCSGSPARWVLAPGMKEKKIECRLYSAPTHMTGNELCERFDATCMYIEKADFLGPVPPAPRN